MALTAVCCRDAVWLSSITTLANAIFRTIMVPIFLVMCMGILLVPLAGAPVSFVLFCWLYAYYSFEYAIGPTPLRRPAHPPPRSSIPCRSEGGGRVSRTAG